MKSSGASYNGAAKAAPSGAYLDAHLDRLIEATNDLWRQNNSICRKCHKIVGPMNCLFCYCPRYGMTECGGNYRIKVLEDGRKIKDCSLCTFPHQKEVVKAWLKERIYGSL